MISPDMLHKISRKTLLTPELTSIWDSISLGVTVIDADGYCVYMNKVQKTTDGLENMPVEGQHISKFYIPYRFDTLAILQCLGTGQPSFRETYWYKTTTNKLINAMNDVIPLFENGKIDGVLSFSSIFGLPAMTDEAHRPAGSRSKDESFSLYSFESIIGNSPMLKKDIDIARAAAQSSSHVMIWGESGTGKELFAQAIHGEGIRKNKPFIPINCAAIPENLLEGFMFGTAKGAFTDAADRAGLFENANGGTLLLDEINSMHLGLQAKLLRAIQENKIRRVGSQKEIPINVRINSILNESPLQAMEKGTLRSDLYYRLAVVGIAVPALRERKEDILYLADHFIRSSGLASGNVRLSDSVLSMFVNYDWPGNIRELQHAIEGSMAMLNGAKWILPEHLPQQFLEAYSRKHDGKSLIMREMAAVENMRQNYQKPIQSYYDFSDLEERHAPTSLKSSLMEYERNCIRNALRFTGWNVAKAARILEMKPAALHYRINLLGLEE